jgi:hypothetical protein
MQYLNGRICKKKFTLEEDALLSSLVSNFGPNNWQVISAHMSNRNVRQCRERYNNYLNPKLRQGEWTPEEDDLLTGLVMKYGVKWNKIAQSFVDRSDLSLRNRWQQIERRIAKANEMIPAEVGSPVLSGQTALDVSPVSQPSDTAARPVSPYNLTDIFDFCIDGSDPWSNF